MPSFEINIKTTDDPRGIEDATEKTVKLTDAAGKLLERMKRKEEYAAAKEALSGLNAEQKDAALSAYQLAKAQEDVDGTMGQSKGAAQEQTGLLSGLKSSWMEIYAAIQIAKEVWQAMVEVWNQTAGLELQLANQGRDLAETIGSTAEEATTLIAVGKTLKISAGTIQSAFEAAIKKGFDPSIEGLKQLQARFQAIQDPVQQTKFLIDTFGRSGNDLRDLLELDSTAMDDLTASAKYSGEVLTQTQLDQARAYEMASAKLEGEWTRIKMQAANVLIPTITNLISADAEAVAGMKAHVEEVNKLKKANDVLNGSLEKTNGNLTTRGNLFNSANYHAPGSEGYNPSGYVWTEGRATGGPVRAGRMYSINENKPWSGPEYFVAPSDGMIIPGGGASQGGGGSPISFPFVYAPQFSLADQAEAERVFRPFVERAMRELGVKR